MLRFTSDLPDLFRAKSFSVLPLCGPFLSKLFGSLFLLFSNFKVFQGPIVLFTSYNFNALNLDFQIQGLFKVQANPGKGVHTKIYFLP